MGEKIIKTVKGEKHPEKNCRLIDGCYYLIGNNKVEDSGDVYLINSRYIRASTGRVVFDQFEQEYKLKNNTLIEGIVGTDGNELILGYFSRNDIYNVRVILKDMSERIAISYNVLGYAYREKKSDGIFYHISLIEANKFGQLRGVSREVKESLPYDSKGCIAKAVKNYESNYNPVICPGAQTVGEALKNYTFGLEFETSVGIIPNSKLNVLPLIPLRDGSIEGLEYATIPLQGPKGVQAIIDSADELRRRTRFNEGCSLHLHIGGMPRTVEFILAFYKLMSFYQNEIFAMFPLYKKYNFGIKRKNYSAPFPFEEINFQMDPVINPNDKKQVLKNFDFLFRYLSGGHTFAEYNNDLANVQVHPQDPDGRQKWNIKHRYSFINFIPLIFGNHQTIEFRIHTPTYSPNKIIDFLMLNTFFIDYVASHYKSILSNTDMALRRFSLHAFLDEYIGNLNNVNKNIYNELSHYISERKSHTDGLTRDNGVVYAEDEMHTSKYLRFNTYKFKKQSLSPFELEDDSPLARFSFEVIQDDDYRRRQLEAVEKAREAMLKAKAQKKPNRKDRRSSLGPGLREQIEPRPTMWSSAAVTGTGDPVRFYTNTGTSNTSSSGIGMSIGIDPIDPIPQPEVSPEVEKQAGYATDWFEELARDYDNEDNVL